MAEFSNLFFSKWFKALDVSSSTSAGAKQIVNGNFEILIFSRLQKLLLPFSPAHHTLSLTLSLLLDTQLTFELYKFRRWRLMAKVAVKFDSLLCARETVENVEELKLFSDPNSNSPEALKATSGRVRFPKKLIRIFQSSWTRPFCNFLAFPVGCECNWKRKCENLQFFSGHKPSCSFSSSGRVMQCTACWRQGTHAFALLDKGHSVFFPSNLAFLDDQLRKILY